MLATRHIQELHQDHGGVRKGPRSKPWLPSDNQTCQSAAEVGLGGGVFNAALDNTVRLDRGVPVTN